ncbi:MAG: glycosyltransferase family 2 protein [Bacteroidetes bacterium]|nr:glycosyltransferase family 2 protein [Bacteroidota bacterium]
MAPDVSAIFVHYGSLDHTERAVRQLASFPAPTRELIVIDNASEHPFPADRYPHIRTLRLTENHGYGYACNRGAELANGRALFILNNDLEFPADPLPALLHELVETPNCGAVGPVLRFPDGRFQLSWGDHPTLYTEFHERRRQLESRNGGGDALERRKAASRHARTVDWITGACMLLPRAAWEAAGGFDEAYFFYFEDADLCRRLQRMGYVVRYRTDAEVVHYGGRSDPLADPNIVVSYRREQLRYYSRYNSALSFFLLKRYLLRKFTRLQSNGTLPPALAAQVRDTVRNFSRVRERESFQASYGKKS